MYLCEGLSKFQSTTILRKGSISQSNFRLTLEVSSNLTAATPTQIEKLKYFYNSGVIICIYCCTY